MSSTNLFNIHPLPLKTHSTQLSECPQGRHDLSCRRGSDQQTSSGFRLADTSSEKYLRFSGKGGPWNQYRTVTIGSFSPTISFRDQVFRRIWRVRFTPHSCNKHSSFDFVYQCFPARREKGTFNLLHFR